MKLSLSCAVLLGLSAAAFAAPARVAELPPAQMPLDFGPAPALDPRQTWPFPPAWAVRGSQLAAPAAELPEPAWFQLPLDLEPGQLGDPRMNWPFARPAAAPAPAVAAASVAAESPDAVFDGAKPKPRARRKQK